MEGCYEMGRTERLGQGRNVQSCRGLPLCGKRGDLSLVFGGKVDDANRNKQHSEIRPIVSRQMVVKPPCA